MKINKQLFEDVFSGKLKGTFVLRNKLRIKTEFLTKSNFELLGFLYKLHESYVVCADYTEYGKASNCAGSDFDIIDFIPDTDMKENELTIEVPEGKIVDWDESKKQNKIVLKDKQLTYEEICDRLPGMIDIPLFGTPSKDGNALVANEHYLECLLAKNMLATVAKYLNNGWKPSRTNLGHFDAWVLYTTPNKDYIGYVKISDCAHNSNVLFKSKDLARQAIEILGEETVKLALEPLGV